MSNRIKTLFLVVGLMFGLLSGGSLAAAQTPGNTVPTTKTPTSERFDITGSITSDQNKTPITGLGALSGSNAEVGLTTSLPGSNLASGSITVSLISVDNKIYFKISGLPGQNQDQWYVEDLGAAGSTSGGIVPGMPGSMPTNPAFSDAYTVTQIGKEMINGAVTTKYQIDVDENKILQEAASQSGTALPAPEPGTATSTKLTMWMWIGDADQYLYQIRLSSSSTATVQGVSSTSAFDITITFHDFDAPVTITAPANAQPFDVGTLGQMGTNPAFGALGIPLGTSLGMPLGVASSMPAGMPTTGSGAQDNPLPWLALGLLCVACGLAVRRKTASV